MVESHNMILPFSLGGGLHDAKLWSWKGSLCKWLGSQDYRGFKYFALVGIQETTKAQARMNKKVKGFVFTCNSKDLSFDK